jgi:SAM-dependent methyltransferase
VSCGPPPDEHLVAFYTSIEDEAARLSLPRNRLEFLRTQELLRQRLPTPPARLLDVGGGTGAHAAWLAADGYAVTLLDVVPAHVERARALSITLDRPFQARVGDARDLDIPDDDVDACLLLGPLYHLPELADRVAALAQAVRVTRSGGLVAAASISRYAWPLYELRNGGGLDDIRSLERTIASGRPDPGAGFTTAYSHRPDELADEFAAAGLVEIEVLGIEGPGWWWFARDAAPERIEALVEPSLRIARLYDGYRDIAGASAHLLACGRVASG